ncbi:CLUMA_CG009378, isoform A [Clunio marinus]|uniref:CLUMA_CG009378, isoform A n=1 Tax=Clunio marinus TaxID=568069 RepID=A0A1J1I6L6_9DIPT|nr:CLUMA_CG009378, isoform A [Clunio marinus]
MLSLETQKRTFLWNNSMRVHSQKIQMFRLYVELKSILNHLNNLPLKFEPHRQWSKPFVFITNNGKFSLC